MLAPCLLRPERPEPTSPDWSRARDPDLQRYPHDLGLTVAERRQVQDHQRLISGAGPDEPKIDNEQSPGVGPDALLGEQGVDDLVGADRRGVGGRADASADGIGRRGLDRLQ